MWRSPVASLRESVQELRSPSESIFLPLALSGVAGVFFWAGWEGQGGRETPELGVGLLP